MFSCLLSFYFDNTVIVAGALGTVAIGGAIGAVAAKANKSAIKDIDLPKGSVSKSDLDKLKNISTSKVTVSTSLPSPKIPKPVIPQNIRFNQSDIKNLRDAGIEFIAYRGNGHAFDAKLNSVGDQQQAVFLIAARDMKKAEEDLILRAQQLKDKSHELKRLSFEEFVQGKAIDESLKPAIKSKFEKSELIAYDLRPKNKATVSTSKVVNPEKQVFDYFDQFIIKQNINLKSNFTNVKLPDGSIISAKYLASGTFGDVYEYVIRTSSNQELTLVGKAFKSNDMSIAKNAMDNAAQFNGHPNFIRQYGIIQDAYGNVI